MFRALNTTLRRVVALKLIPADPDDPAAARRLRVEAEAAARVAHPHVAQVFGAFEAGGCSVLELEYVAGESLAAHLDRGRAWPAAGAVALVAATARGVGAAHAADVLHRDLKPANILLTPDDAPKVIDFGLAKRLDATSTGTQSGAFAGSPAYAAPEQLDGRAADLRPTADVWALGVVLYQMLAGRLPFAGADMRAVVTGILRDTPAPPLGASADGVYAADVNAVCLKCLEKDPRARYRTADELADDLERALRGEPTRARPPGPFRRIGRRVRRHKVGAALAAAGAVAVLAGAILLVATNRNTEAVKNREDASRQAEVTELRDRVRGLENLSDCRPADLPARLEQLDAEHAKLDRTEDDGADRRRRLNNLVADHLRGELRAATTPEVADRLRAATDWLEPRDPAAGREVRAALDRQLAIRWEPVLDLKPPFADAPAAFTGGVKVEPDGSRAHTGAPGSAEVFLQLPPDVRPGQLEVSFDAAGAAGRELGLLLDAQPGGHGGPVRSLVFARDGKSLVVGSADGNVSAWNPVSGTHGKMMPPNNDLTGAALVTPDAALIVAARRDGKVDVFDTKANRAGEQLAAKGAGPLAVSPDGARIAVGPAAGGVQLWDVATRKVVRELRGPAVRALAFGAGGTLLAGVAADGSAVVWDVARGAPAHTLPAERGGFTAAALTPDERTLVLGTGSGAVVVYDLHDGRGVAALARPGAGAVLALALAADGEQLAVGHETGLVAAWSLALRQPKGDLRGRGPRPVALTFAPDGKTLAVGSDDGGVELWDAPREKVRVRLGARGLAFTLTVLDTRPSGTQETLSLAALQARGGRALLRVARDGEALAEREVTLEPGRLRLRARRDGGRIEFQAAAGSASAAPPLVFHDTSAKDRLPRNGYAIRWPAGTKVVRVEAARPVAPAAAPPLLRADALFGEKQFGDAAAEYRKQYEAAPDTPLGRAVKAQALTKHGFCELREARPADAAKLFELAVNVGGADRGEFDWPLVAAVQLWLHHLRAFEVARAKPGDPAGLHPDLERANTVLDRHILPRAVRWADLAPFVSERDRQKVIDLYERAAAKREFLSFGRRVPHALAAADRVYDFLGAPPAQRWNVKCRLVDALWMGGDAGAAEEAVRAMHRTPANADPATRLAVLGRYCWLLRCRGAAAAGLELVNAELGAVPHSGANTSGSGCGWNRRGWSGPPASRTRPPRRSTGSSPNCAPARSARNRTPTRSPCAGTSATAPGTRPARGGRGPKVRPPSRFARPSPSCSGAAATDPKGSGSSGRRFTCWPGTSPTTS